MLFKWTYAALFTVACLEVCVAVAAAENDIDTDIVYCPDQKEACTCRKTAKACHCQFRLSTEELQTLASYEIDVDGKIISRGKPGDTYNADGHGNVDPSLPFEIGSCWNSSLISVPLASESDYEYPFKSRRCSFPMFVDGNSYRKFTAVNGRIPGPTLIVYEGQYTCNS